LYIWLLYSEHTYFVSAFVFISTKDVQNKEIKLMISFSILVNWQKITRTCRSR
jgi:hypothetical protein